MNAGDRPAWWRLMMPWAILATVLGVAVWHAVDFSEAADPEFPRVTRLFFSARPPAAYRLAEPGDTLDRIGLYLGAVAAGISLVTLGARFRANRRRSPSVETPDGIDAWPAALVVSLAIAFHAATPGPTFDGWHGLGFRVLVDSACPVGVRLAVGLLVALGLLIVGSNLRRVWSRRPPGNGTATFI